MTRTTIDELRKLNDALSIENENLRSELNMRNGCYKRLRDSHIELKKAFKQATSKRSVNEKPTA